MIVGHLVFSNFITSITGEVVMTSEKLNDHKLSKKRKELEEQIKRDFEIIRKIDDPLIDELDELDDFGDEIYGE